MTQRPGNHLKVGDESGSNGQVDKIKANVVDVMLKAGTISKLP